MVRAIRTKNKPKKIRKKEENFTHLSPTESHVPKPNLNKNEDENEKKRKNTHLSNRTAYGIARSIHSEAKPK